MEADEKKCGARNKRWIFKFEIGISSNIKEEIMQYPTHTIDRLGMVLTFFVEKSHKTKDTYSTILVDEVVDKLIDTEYSKTN